MANSGIYWVDLVFNYCVKLLYDVASIMGISYEEINVWVFCIVWPIATIIILGEMVRLKIQIRRFKRLAYQSNSKAF
ncbi:hypothetical protein N9Y91_02690 [Alphaproteobacteria bacterium]|nr:hypothetical protein [Alphaproteobacteria bacterium]